MSAMLTMQIDKGLDKVIRQLAKEEKVSKAVIVRHMIKEYLDNHNIEYEKKLTA